MSVEDFISDENWEKVTTSFNLFKDNPRPIKIDKLGGPRISELIENFDVDGIAINLGSGQDDYDGFVNIDLGSYKPVDIVADLKDIPFNDNSVDYQTLIISDFNMDRNLDILDIIELVNLILN